MVTTDNWIATRFIGWVINGSVSSFGNHECTRTIRVMEFTVQTRWLADEQLWNMLTSNWHPLLQAGM